MDTSGIDAQHYFNLFKVPNQQGDMVTLPIMHDVSKDKEWMVHSLSFFDRVVGRGYMDEDKFWTIAHQFKLRRMTEPELEWLVEVKFLHPKVLGVDQEEYLLASSDVLEILKKDELGGKCTIQAMHFSHLPPFGATSADDQDNKVFPQKLPVCSLEGSALTYHYSIHATHPAYAKEGTMWSKQLAAMATSLKTPPFTHSGTMTALGPTTIKAIQQTMSELAGYALNHKMMEPTIEHAMDANLISHFLAFRLKRNNNPATLMKLLQHIKYVVTFIMECPCPGVKTWSTTHSSLLHTWLRNVVANQRHGIEEWVEAHKDKRARIDVDMAPVWEHVEAKFDATMDAYKVGTPPWLDLHGALLVVHSLYLSHVVHSHSTPILMACRPMMTHSLMALHLTCWRLGWAFS